MVATPAPQSLEGAGGRGSRDAQLVCLAGMLGALPAQLVRPQWPQLLPWMVAALQPVGRRRPELQPALLASLQDALRDSHGGQPSIGQSSWRLTWSSELTCMLVPAKQRSTLLCCGGQMGYSAIPARATERCEDFTQCLALKAFGD